MFIQPFERPSVDLFDGLDDEIVWDLLRQAQTHRFPAGTLLCRERQPARAVHVLLSGYVKMVQTMPSGEHVITRYVRPGEAFGMPALLNGLYPADAVTVTTCLELQWPASVIKALAARHPAVALNVIHDLEARLREMEGRTRDLSNAPVERRVAHALSKLAERFGRIVPDGIELPFPLSRQDLADLAGTTLHTVSRTLGSWEAQGHVRRGRRRVVVTDVAALNELAVRGGSSESRPRRPHRRTGGCSRSR
jgi:CRP/FNR family transcriptional regulator, nitrogen oxide reductase regulator